MVVGTYEMTDFNLNTIPPGVIDHKEWTPDNGRNNASRINGLGAPRAFYTPVLRDIKVPNTSYGEDYALGLAISRQYQIGRVYDVVYLCRRWDDNSDASLDIVKQNNHNRIKTVSALGNYSANPIEQRNERSDKSFCLTHHCVDWRCCKELAPWKRAEKTIASPAITIRCN